MDHRLQARKAASAERVLHLLAAATLGLGLLFWAGFQLAKAEPLGALSPFAEDPYDAVGSFAAHALLVGVLTYARALRLTREPALPGRRILVRRGAQIVLAAVALTLAVDLQAVVAAGGVATTARPLVLGMLGGAVGGDQARAGGLGDDVPG